VNENIFNFDRYTGSTINEVKGKNRRVSLDIHTLEPNLSDPRSMSSEEISALISGNENLTNPEKEEFISVLLKYKILLTAKPGKCTVFEYQFEVKESTPFVAQSRPIPLAVYEQDRRQIQQMLKDDILELSDSPVTTPVSEVHREGKSLRPCVDAHRINTVTVPDRTRAPPLQELLQRFHGARFMTSLDLSSAFLQIPLKKESRKYTAFLFQTQVYA
jgi:hypothetical protein